ncbi:mannitol 2-dehydrogenase [Fistulifera solaris]|uniref:mannitol 2-dehydrogenase n=1 Tax=Fistulifera solaris TaxID=1519565 RepID=A0A1Z5K332_FISSO|nr:mannitol 2-dehydrogenase [Fistulifera solaris]|eukprot:GAX20481.1 mannitol 2-dehydrogenase [Fistulifera solaris]
MRLSNAILPAIGRHGVAVPNYDPASITPGIFHVGTGNFHRAHLGNYMHELFQQDPTQRHWGIIGSSVRPDTKDAKKKRLADQDWLQTLVIMDGANADARILGSMIDYVSVTDPDDTSPILHALMNPDIRIVSMTITEGGYFLNPHTGKFDPNHPAIRQDVEDIDQASTIFGLIVKALELRREQGMPAFTVLSCDNVPHNGDVCRNVIVGLAQLVDPSLADWIQANASFPNSMVDRIAIATGDRERSLIEKKYGYEDVAPVVCEPFTQWVLEDDFCQGRPAWEQLESIQFVEDVEPFERMKIRILNGGHASLCYSAALLDIDFVHQAMEHPVLGPFLDTLERNEIIPTVGQVPGMDLTDYWDTIQSRFANSAMCDTVARNVAQGSDRQTKFIIPVIQANLAEGHSDLQGLATVSALWCRYCQGKTESGKVIEPNDNLWDRLHETALSAMDNPVVWLEMEDIYGDCGKNRLFVHHFTEALQTIQKEGVEAALKKYVESFAAAVA